MLSQYNIYIGIFIIAAFLSVSTGTSVGAIVALAPIIVGIANQGGVSLPILCGGLLGGAMFGDNLSVISDTTIAAKQSLGCKMSDKFKQNIKIALPAEFATIVILIIQEFGFQPTEVIETTQTVFSFKNITLFVSYCIKHNWD
jgi:Na+/H+ antiporter NhaC